MCISGHKWITGESVQCCEKCSQMEFTVIQQYNTKEAFTVNTNAIQMIWIHLKIQWSEIKNVFLTKKRRTNGIHNRRDQQWKGQARVKSAQIAIKNNGTLKSHSRFTINSHLFSSFPTRSHGLPSSLSVSFKACLAFFQELHPNY